MGEQMAVPLPSFTDLATSLVSMKSTTGPAEMHGLLSGVICSGKRMDGKNWLDLIQGIMHDDEAGDFKECRKVLVSLYEITSSQLKNNDFNFHLLLPPEEDPINERAQCLSEWCAGFMYGLGISGLCIDDTSNNDCQEALYHIAEISKLDYTDIDVSDHDENCFMEVMEYVRMAVLMLYTEFAYKSVAVAESERVLH